MQKQHHSLTFSVSLDSDLQSLVSSHPDINFTNLCTFNLTLDKQIDIQDLIKHLNLSYQTLVNYNPLIKYEIYPSSLELIKRDRFPKTCLGGTFDNLHSGHLLLLTYASLLTQNELTIGITLPEMLLKKKYQQIVQSYPFREENVKRFLNKLNPGIGLRFAKLQQPYGPPLVQQDYQAIIVSTETLEGAQSLNKQRTQKAFPQMKIFTITYIQSPKGTEEKKNQKVSSTSIRKYLFEKNRFIEEGVKQKYHNMWLHLHTKMQKEFVEKNEQQVDRLSEIEFDKIFESYSERWRHFHTNQHIHQMLMEFFVLPTLESKEEEIEIVYAIFYHDIIYDPRSQTNEEDSANVWREYVNKLKPYFEKPLDNMIQKVSALILSTKKHQPTNHLEERLTDLDMGILDSEPAKYEQYAKDIQNEYSPLFPSIDVYFSKRRQFLQSLDLTKVFSHRKVKYLKDNVHKELERLRSQQKDTTSDQPAKL